jgi:O-antigen biosynthesis protein
MSRLRVIDFLEGQQVLRSREAPTAPAVSVILPTYRRRASGELQRAIESVLAQSFEDLELVVMDDGSTDGSADLIDDIRARDGRVVHVRHEVNCGIHTIRLNEGIDLARGRYLAFQFDDDVWRPHALARLTEALTHLNRPGLAIGKAHYTSPSGECVLPEGELNRVTL